MKGKANRVAVITVAFNKGSVLEKCIRGLKKSKDKNLFDIFVVDNGSKDNIGSITKKHSVKYLRLEKNYFASKAINLGFEYFQISKRYKYLLIMGSDVLVDPDLIRNLWLTMEKDPSIGKTGPAHYEINTNTLMTYGLNINPLTSLLVNTLNPKKRTGMNHFHSLYMVRTDLYKKISGLDDVLYPMIYEEPDLGQRILHAGYKILSTPKGKIWHSLDFQTPSEKKLVIRKERLYNSIPKAYLFFRNRIIYMSLYSNFFQFIFFYILVNPVITFHYLRDIESSYIPYALQGIYDGTVFALFKKRKFIAKRNKIVLNI